MLPLQRFLSHLLVVSVTSISCASQTPQESTMSEARLEANRSKMHQLETRLQDIERKTKDLDAIAIGVKQLLAKLAQMEKSGGLRPPTPSPTAIYSLPIDGDPYIGPKYAKVTMVKGYDFYCGFCDKILPTLTQLRKEYGNDLKIVFKNFVINDDYARLPALAACAAHQQQTFMPMFDKIWEKGIRARHELTELDLKEIAADLKLNEKRFDKDMHGLCEDKVQSDNESMAAIGATGTPVFYINGRFLSGAMPKAKYKKIINQEIEKANQALAAGVKLKSYYQLKVVKEGRTSL